MDKLTIYKDNKLIEATYKLTRMENRLMLYCIGKLNPTNPMKEQVIYIDDFLKQFPDIDKKNVYKQIKNAIDALAERWVIVKNPKFLAKFRWVQAVKYYNDEGSAIIKFSDDIMPYLSQLEEQFTQYNLRNISSFKGIYSIRLYELITQYRNLKKREISISDLKQMLCIEDKYPEWKELRRNVILPAIKEINEKSDLIIDFEPIRVKKTYQSLIFSIAVNPISQANEKQARGLKQLAEIKRKLKK